MHWIHIARIRCEPLQQGSLFVEERSPTTVISDCIIARPTAEVGRGSSWHIGASNVMTGDGISFQMGRVQEITSPQYDSIEHSFFEAQAERAPYTLAIYDQRHQCCGIVRKSGVSQSANEICSKLQTLLNSTDFPQRAGVRIVVDPLVDPENFIEQLRNSAEIVKFSFTAGFENPFDVDTLIQRPAEKFNQTVGGSQTKVEVEGPNLNKDVLEELSRAVASTGDKAAASIRKKPRQKSKRIYLKGTPLQEPLDIPSDKSPFQAMLAATRAAYDRIRNSLT